MRHLCCYIYVAIQSAIADSIITELHHYPTPLSSKTHLIVYCDYNLCANRYFYVNGQKIIVNFAIQR